MRIHILGICGTLMGSIALLARAAGHRVTGTDENVYPPMSTQLEQAGITLSSGYREDSIPDDAELVIVGNANLPRGNPALEAVLNKNIPYTSGAEWLARYLLSDRWVIAVAGTHGKTTTTSMIAWILEYAGLSPGFLVGGIPGNFSQSSSLGETPFFVIEADEYDTSYFDRRSKFLHYRPRTLVLNNLEFDHADIFPDLEAIMQQFHLLLRTVPSEGLVILPGDDENLAQLIERGCWTPTLTTGKDIDATNPEPDGSSFDVNVNGQRAGRVHWTLSGAHNVRNALAAIAAARHAGVSPETACEALCHFKGVKRRMELIYQNDQLHIYDDFAHHPTAIATTLSGLRNKVGSARILAVIEPASHTMRLGTHENTLRTSVNDADDVIWFQPQNVRWDMQQLVENNRFVEASLENLLNKLLDYIRANDEPLHIVIMSNGAFGGIHSRLVESLGL